MAREGSYAPSRGNQIDGEVKHGWPVQRLSESRKGNPSFEQPCGLSRRKEVLDDSVPSSCREKKGSLIEGGF